MNGALFHFPAASMLTAMAMAQEPPPLAPAFESYVAHIAAAEGALARGATGSAWRWLDAVPAAERGFEWRLLAAEAEQSLAAFPLHAAGMTSVVVSPDGATTAIGTSDGAVLLFATAALTGQSPPSPIRRIAAHQQMIYCLCFDGAGQRLASSSADRGAAVWDVATGKQLARFERHTYPVGSIRFAPDGKRVCSSSYQRPKGGEVRIWDAASGDELAVLLSGYAPMTCSHWSPDGQRIVGASWDQQLHVFELAKPESPLVVRLGSEAAYRAAQGSALSPDGGIVAVACKDDQVHLFEAFTGKAVRDLVGHTKIVDGVAFAPDGKLLASVSADTSVRLWDVATGAEVATLRGHRGQVRGVAFTADGSRLFTASADGTLRVWDVAGARQANRRLPLAKTGYCVAERPDGGALALGDSAGGLHLLSPKDGRVLETVAADDGWINTVRWRQVAGGGWQLLAAGNQLLQLWDLGGKARRTFATADAAAPKHGCGGGMDGAARSPDGARIAAVSRDNRARAWDAATGALQWQIDFPRQQLWAEFSPDGGTLGICGLAGAALHDPTTGAVRVPLSGHRGGVKALQFTPDGKAVLTLGDDGWLRVWNAADGATVASLRAHDGRGAAAALSPDGSRLATCGEDDRLVLWDVSTRAAVWSRDLKDGYCLSWSADGQRLWVLPLGKELLCLDAVPVRDQRR